MTFPYEDILHHPHHVSGNHAPLSMAARAAQFSAFSALSGYEEAAAEQARLTDPGPEPDEAAAAELNRKLNFLQAKLAETPAVRITCFVPDERKTGGIRVAVTGKVKQISPAEGVLVLTDGTRIGLRSVTDITGAVFESGEFEL